MNLCVDRVNGPGESLSRDVPRANAEVEKEREEAAAQMQINLVTSDDSCLGRCSFLIAISWSNVCVKVFDDKRSDVLVGYGRH